MKRILSLSALMGIVLMLSLAVSAQTKIDSVKPAIRHSAKPLTDSTPVLQARDLQELINILQDYPARYTNPITQWLQQRYYARKTELGY